MIKERIWHGYLLHLPGMILALSLTGTTASSQGVVIVSSKVGECDLTIESNENWHTLRLRAHHPRYMDCQIDRSSMLSVLDEAFSTIDSTKGSFSSLSIGRLIDYPWLSQYLATTAYGDREWDSKKGKPAAMDINKYAAQLLFRNEMTAQIATVFKRGGYTVEGVTVEKVLVGDFREVPSYQGTMHPGRVPYDAQVWYRLKRKAT